MPTEPNNITIEFNELWDEIIPQFCGNINDTLHPKHVANYIVKLTNRMRDEIEQWNDKNKASYEDWLDLEYDDIAKSRKKIKLTSIEEIGALIYTISSEWEEAFCRVANVPSELCKIIAVGLSRILADHTFEEFKQIGQQILDLSMNQTKETSSQIETITNQLLKTQELYSNEKRINEERLKEKSELFASKIELESKNERILRDLKNKEKESQELLKIESQKYTKLEEYYEKVIKEKDNLIVELETKARDLNSSIYDLNKDISCKSLTFTKENNKLNVEIEHLKGEKKTKNISDNTVGLKSLFQSIQEFISDFKKGLDQLERDRDGIVFY